MAEMDVSAISQPFKQADDGFAGGMPLATVKVIGDSGTETIEIRKNKDEYYAKASVGGGIYKISPTTSEGIVKTPDDFRDKKLFDFGDDDPDKVELQDGSKTYDALEIRRRLAPRQRSRAESGYDCRPGACGQAAQPGGHQASRTPASARRRLPSP